jgi:hypothetical protein
MIITILTAAFLITNPAPNHLEVERDAYVIDGKFIFPDVPELTLKQILQGSVILKIEEYDTGERQIRILSDFAVLADLIRLTKNGTVIMPQFPARLQSGDIRYKSGGLICVLVLKKGVDIPPLGKKPAKSTLWTAYVKAKVKEKIDKGETPAFKTPVYAWEEPTLALRIEKNITEIVLGELKWLLDYHKMQLVYWKSELVKGVKLKEESEKKYLEPGKWKWSCDEADKRHTREEIPLFESDSHYQFCRALFSEIALFKSQRDNARKGIETTEKEITKIEYDIEFVEKVKLKKGETVEVVK